MPTYGPSRSPYGPNQALDQLAKRIKDGDAPINAETAQQVIDIVQEDGRVTVEEDASLKGLWETALDRKDAPDTTAWGRELLLEFVDEARGRLFAHQANRSVSPMNMWVNMVSWGMLDTKPSYIDIDKSPRTGDTTDTIAVEARKETIEEFAGFWKIVRLIEAEHPTALEDPGNTHQRPTLQPDVEARYQELKKDLMAGTVDENDPLAPMRSYLDANY